MEFSKALVTGTPGWMGTRLTVRLLQEGRAVRCLAHPSMPVESISRLGAEAARADLTDPAALSGVCDGVSVVFHCAGLILGRTPGDFFRVNAGATENLAREAIRAGVRRFVYVSSNCAALGDSWPDEVDEDFGPRPFYAYGASKLAAERLLLDHHRSGRLEVIVVRPNWLYGAGGHLRQLNFIRMVRRGRPVIFGDGNNLHTLCDIHNCVDALMLAARSERPGGTYYLGDTRPYSMLEVCRTIAELLGVEIRPRFIPAPLKPSAANRTFDRLMQMTRFRWSHLHMAWEWSKNLRCSVKKSEAELGVRPSVDLREGMRRAIEEYRRNGTPL